MKLLFDFLPLLLFFVAFRIWDIYVATAVAIAASVAQIAWLLLRRRPVEPMQWASLGIIAVFGGMTLLLQDETFIKWKPTVLYGLFAGVLVVSQQIFGRNLIRSLLGKQFRAPDVVWGRLNLVWSAFFAAMAVLNLVVAYSVPTDVWVQFKVFGTLALTLVFVVAQAFWLGRFVEES